jgi:hypothetical protein
MISLLKGQRFFWGLVMELALAVVAQPLQDVQ